MAAQPTPTANVVQTPLRANPSPSSFPFLDLPLELRLQVYQYLVPDQDIIEARNFGSETLRHDGQRCCISLLRTNHQIYEEFLNEWYGLKTYELTLWSGSFWFLKSPIQAGDYMPATILAVSSFSIDYDMRMLYEHPVYGSLMGELYGALPLHAALFDRLFAEPKRSCQQRKLLLNIRITPAMFNRVRGIPHMLLKQLRINLPILRQYPSVKIRATFSFSTVVDVLHSRTRNFEEDKAGMLYTAREFFRRRGIEIV